MRYLPYDHAANTALLTAVWRWIRQRVAGAFPPMERRPHLSPGSRPRRQWVALAVLVLSVLVQVVLLWLLGQLVDLCISLMELWAELARKHLEITL